MVLPYSRYVYIAYWSIMYLTWLNGHNVSSSVEKSILLHTAGIYGLLVYMYPTWFNRHKYNVMYPAQLNEVCGASI